MERTVTGSVISAAFYPSLLRGLGTDTARSGYFAVAKNPEIREDIHVLLLFHDVSAASDVHKAKHCQLPDRESQYVEYFQANKSPYRDLVFPVAVGFIRYANSAVDFFHSQRAARCD